MKHLQRLGLPLGEKPGKGKRIDYSREQIWQLALALELSQFGLDPIIIVRLITDFWSKVLEPHFVEQFAGKRPKGTALVIKVALMSASWRSTEESMQGLVSIGWRDQFSTVDSIISRKNSRALIVDVWGVLRNLQEQLESLSEA